MARRPKPSDPFALQQVMIGDTQAIVDVLFEYTSHERAAVIDAATRILEGVAIRTPKTAKRKPFLNSDEDEE